MVRNHSKALSYHCRLAKFYSSTDSRLKRIGFRGLLEITTMDIVRLGTGRMIRFVPGHCKKLVYATTVERGWSLPRKFGVLRHPGCGVWHESALGHFRLKQRTLPLPRRPKTQVFSEKNGREWDGPAALPPPTAHRVGGGL